VRKKKHYGQELLAGFFDCAELFEFLVAILDWLGGESEKDAPGTWKDSWKGPERGVPRIIPTRQTRPVIQGRVLKCSHESLSGGKKGPYITL